ncbi:MAG: DUF2293 domain-containing protein [Myxococcales bacterium]|nr:DUF2293 domain-containing protein [Myxococcales bacterium]
MPTETRTVRPGPRKNTVQFDSGEVVGLPEGWAILPPGDAGLTRRVKAAGPSWTVKQARGRKLFSRGVWAPAVNIETARKRLEVERADPSYQRRLDASRRRRDVVQSRYVDEFEAAIVGFLAFAPVHQALAVNMAARVAAHATPVGSGTVARTQRIPIEERAKAAVMAWMRHQTTDYDHRVVARQKGKRREVRRQLAKASRRILARYRQGEPVQPDCPLARALAHPGRSTAVPTAKLAKASAKQAPVGQSHASQRPVARAARLEEAPPTPSRKTAPRPTVKPSRRWPKIARLPRKP